MGSTPPPPPTSTSPSDDDLPRHIPVDMGMAPRAHPYEKHSVYPPQPKQPPPQQQHHSHQHSLSPEQLGVVGYVKDVAGFVKDTVQDIRQRRRSSESAEQQQQQQKQLQPESEALSTPQKVSPPPPAQQQLASSPLATIATGMFPGIVGSGQGQDKQQQQQQSTGTSPPCTHAEALRQDLREQLQYSTNADKEHRLL